MKTKIPENAANGQTHEGLIFGAPEQMFDGRAKKIWHNEGKKCGILDDFGNPFSKTVCENENSGNAEAHEGFLFTPPAKMLPSSNEGQLTCSGYKARGVLSVCFD